MNSTSPIESSGEKRESGPIVYLILSLLLFFGCVQAVGLLLRRLKRAETCRESVSSSDARPEVVAAGTSRVTPEELSRREFNAVD